MPFKVDAAMPLAQFADPWQKVPIKPDTEVLLDCFLIFFASIFFSFHFCSENYFDAAHLHND